MSNIKNYIGAFGAAVIYIVIAAGSPQCMKVAACPPTTNVIEIGSVSTAPKVKEKNNISSTFSYLAYLTERARLDIAASCGLSLHTKIDYKPQIWLPSVKLEKNRVFKIASGLSIGERYSLELEYKIVNRLNYSYAKKFLWMPQIYGDTYPLSEFRPDIVEGYYLMHTYKHKIAAKAVLLNYTLNANINNAIKPYIKYGFGIVRARSGPINLKIGPDNIRAARDFWYAIGGLHPCQFAYQVGIGVNYNVNKNVAINIVNYEFIDLAKVFILVRSHKNQTLSSNFRVHNIGAGIVLKF